MKLILLMLVSASFIGCMSVTYDAHIETIKPYEGHFMTTTDFYKATENIQLEEGESIWVLSNRTLKRTLKNVREGK